MLGKNPLDMPMVKYWKTKTETSAKLMTLPDGSQALQMEGEDEIFHGYPRGHSLYGSLSPLKHQIKNQIFNDAWAMLEDGQADSEIIKHIKQTFRTGLTEFWKEVSVDALPYEKLVPAVKEIWRALTVLEKESTLIKPIKEMLCFILQEDDAYRFRVQWVFDIFRPRWWGNPIKWFLIAMTELENAEVVGDMKERQRLLKQILTLMLEDKRINYLFKKFCKEVNWNKVKLSRADKYHFRGKYFKVDFDKFEY